MNDQKMKVLQIASSNMEFFEEQVRVLREKGIQCDVLYATSRLTDAHSEGTGIINKAYNKLYGHNPIYYALQSTTFYPQVLSTSILNKYDVIHTNSGMVAPFGVLQPNRPLVTTFWGDDVLSDRLYGQYKKLSKYSASLSDASIVRSEEMAKELPVNASIIPSGIDMEKFRPINQLSALEEVGWEEDICHVMFPYHPTQSKKRHPFAEELVTVVDSNMDQDVQLETVHGVPHEDMYLYYNAADVLLLPSLREGSPNTVKEAMACNLPVVSTNVGDVQTRLKSVDNSYVCGNKHELVDGLKRVLERGERSNGREFVEEVSLDSMGDQIISIYRELL